MLNDFRADSIPQEIQEKMEALECFAIELEENVAKDKMLFERPKPSNVSPSEQLWDRLVSRMAL